MSRSALTTQQQLSAIALHSAGFAEAADGRFEAAIEHCPGWTMADLIEHVAGVHWFWTTIAGERLTNPPAADDPRRPQPLADQAAALARFEAGAARLVEVLAAADQSASCWTWAPGQQDVEFVTRHQVQEIVVHHWDAAQAAGTEIVIDPAVAADSVTEFLTVSVASDIDPVPAEKGSLAGAFRLRATDIGTGWTIHGGQHPATVAFDLTAAAEIDDQPEIAGTAAELLLWLYGRVTLDTAVGDAQIAQFRTLCFTD